MPWLVIVLRQPRRFELLSAFGSFRRNCNDPAVATSFPPLRRPHSGHVLEGIAMLLAPYKMPESFAWQPTKRFLFVLRNKK